MDDVGVARQLQSVKRNFVAQKVFEQRISSDSCHTVARKAVPCRFVGKEPMCPVEVDVFQRL